MNGTIIILIGLVIIATVGGIFFTFFDPEDKWDKEDYETPQR